MSNARREIGDCAFPSCDCPGEEPICLDYEQTADEAIYRRILAGEEVCPIHCFPLPCKEICIVHQEHEPCSICRSYIAAGL